MHSDVKLTCLFMRKYNHLTWAQTKPLSVTKIINYIILLYDLEYHTITER
jgi:hypothetical protein